MPKCGRRRIKKRTEKNVDVSERELRQTPRCFVVKGGPVSNHLKDLIQDFREVMSPNCAKALRESRINRLQDYSAVAGHFGVSHLIVFTQTKAGSYMKVAKLPQGPTTTFQLDSYSLSHDVRAAQKRPRGGLRDYTVAAMQVLSGFGAAAAGEKASPKEVLVEMLRGMFPAVDVPNFNQIDCRRTALFSYDPAEDKVHFRHYHITQGTGGIERGVQRLLRTTRLPKLGAKADIADYVLNGGAASESEAEQAVEASGSNGGKIAVRLTETGPRLTLQLIKVEEGVCNGGVLYHRYLTKSPSQNEVLAEKARQKKKFKERNEDLTKKFGEIKSAKKKRDAKKKARGEEQAGGGRDDGQYPPPEKGKGKGKGKGKDKGGKGGGKEGGKGGGKESGKRKGGSSNVLDRFRKSAKKQRTK